MELSDFDKIVINWNNTWPLDRWYRQKYKIPFNSIQHQDVSQIDVYFEWREEQAFKKYEKDTLKKAEKDKLYKEGTWLSNIVDSTSDIDMDGSDWFDKIDVTTILQDKPVEDNG